MSFLTLLKVLFGLFVSVREWQFHNKYLSLSLHMSAVRTLDTTWKKTPSLDFTFHHQDSNPLVGLVPHVRRRRASFQSKMLLTCFKECRQSTRISSLNPPKSHKVITNVTVAMRFRLIASQVFQNNQIIKSVVLMHRLTLMSGTFKQFLRKICFFNKITAF